MYSRKIVLAIILTCIFIPNYAQTNKSIQERPKRNQLMLTMGNGLMLNGFNVKNNEVYPNPISAASAVSYRPSLSLEYQRRTKSGFTYGAGLGFGKYAQDFDVNYSSFDYVEENTAAMDKVTSNQKFRNSCLYAELRLSIGYNTPIAIFGSGDFSFESRLSISNRLYLSGGFFKSDLRLNYISNDTIYLYNYPASLTESHWGNRGQGGFNGPLIMDVYFGLRKDLKNRVFNTLNFGVFATYQVHKRGADIADLADVRVVNGHYKDGNLLYYDTDFYTNEEVVFGFKLGIGLRF